MDTTAYVSLSRQIALMRDMTVLATNIANINTTAFRGEHAVFEEVLERAGPSGRVSFVQDVGTVRDMRPGPLTATGNSLDLAIDGAGWLAFGTSNGTRYSRAGHLEINPQGELVNADGNPVLDDAGGAITVPQNAGQISVAPDGSVSAASGLIGRISLLSFADEAALEPVGGGLFQTQQPSQTAGGGRLVQGMLEGSNVEPVLEMTRLIETTRAFESTQRLIETDHDLQRKAVERVLGA